MSASLTMPVVDSSRTDAVRRFFVADLLATNVSIFFFDDLRADLGILGVISTALAVEDGEHGGDTGDTGDTKNGTDDLLVVVAVFFFDDLVIDFWIRVFGVISETLAVDDGWYDDRVLR